MKQWIVGCYLLVLSAVSVGGDVYEYDQLQLRVYAHYPSDVVTIKEAAKYLLDVTEYKLVTNAELSTAPMQSNVIGRNGIGTLARVNQMMTIEQALWLLIGRDNQLVVDHSHKLISFEPRG